MPSMSALSQDEAVLSREPIAKRGETPAAAPVATVHILSELCKGCWLCVHACPEKCLGMSKDINRHGYRFAVYAGAGCTGCGVCFYTCPEPSTMTVVRGTRPKK